MKNSRYNFLALGILGLLFFLWSLIVSIKYYHFGYDGWDLPLYAQLMWNLCHGSSHNSLFGGNFLISHFNFIAYLLTPFYYFFQSELTLLFFKVIAFFIGSYVLYLIAATKIQERWALLLMIGYVFWPSNMAMLLFEFNFENLALPLILLTYYFFDQKRYVPFLVSGILLMLVKENLPLVVIMFGLSGLWIHRRDRRGLLYWGAVPILMGTGFFVFEMWFLLPALVKSYSFHTSIYWERYSSLGLTPKDILSTVFLNPIKVLALLFPKENVTFIGDLFGPLLVVAILSVQPLLLGLPLFLQNLLSNYTPQQSIGFYYASTLSVFIFLASICSLEHLLKKRRSSLVIFILVAVFIFDAAYFPYWFRKIPWQAKVTKNISRDILSRISSEAGVLTSYSFLPFLSQRKDVYVVGRTQSVFTKQPVHVPESVTYVAINFSDMFIDAQAVKDLVSSEAWSVETAADQVVLLRKKRKREESLLRIQSVVFPFSATMMPINLQDSFVRLIGLEAGRIIQTSWHQKILPVKYFWEIKADPAVQYLLTLVIVQDNKPIWQNTRRICYALPLNKGEFIQERVFYPIPSSISGQFHMTVHLQAIKQVES
ncbi:MAG: DUF2079 domain-containing protein [Candidatus Omnitrophica bacterium]|nr:DUF2079 domain-containing protein [Candidatus Omnitrophota bacterium]